MQLFPSSPALVQSVQSMSLSFTPAQTATWRRQIFEQLNERTRREMDNFRHYEQAVEQVPELETLGHRPAILSKLEALCVTTCCKISLSICAVCVGEEGNHAVVERLEAAQVDRCSLCLGAVLGA